MTNTEWLTRGTGLIACMLLAGCIGTGTTKAEIIEGPQVIIDTPDPDVPQTPDDAPEDDEEDAVDVVTDIVTDILTTSVSVTTIAATGGS